MAGNRTIPRLWREAVARNTGTAYLVERGSGWAEVSWADAAARVELIANGLLARGVRKGDAFALLASNMLEWALFDFALAHVGAVGAAIYANSSPHDVHYVLEHSEAVGVLCEDEAQKAKVDEGRSTLPALRHVLTFAELPALEEEGRAFREAHPGALDDAVATIDEEDLFTFIYTSGTTGPPKGCMIRHRNYHAMVTSGDELPQRPYPGDVMLLYLPLAHNFGRLMHLSGPYRGYTIAFLADPLDVARAISEVRPTVLPSVPRVYEKVHTAVTASFAETTGVKRRLVDWALDVGRRESALRREGRPLPRSLALQHRVADRLVYAKVKERLGGRLRLPISGGAPLAKEIAELFDALGITIIEGYGLTECTTAATTNRSDNYRFGTVGQALPGFELRLADDGELLVRSETVFAGYFKEPAATAEVLDGDGWLRTGDIATIDDDGFVTITDRKKDIIVTAGGKNIAPQNLESDLKTSRFVSQAIVVGDRRPYPAALITLDPVELGKWAQEHGLDGDLRGLAREPRVVELVSGIVDDVNRGRSRYEQLKRFAILDRDFEPGRDEVTPTLKLRRRVVLEHFADVVEGLYDASTETQVSD
ncbi:long-chain fatty acid--CoA ligase [Gaiella sp.]|uniref:AMP-dependent synthetase/ligase n=1 Tax=Gaiella sp. TaxID=2663207 RepID=UPI002E33FFB4|nr:long-chain fatty acid--CoA ligase [Gaiella sp.]HEX5583568.1 long-chain fatty acid--CoA ligase [Gaiella sp.]